ncbi:MAG: MBL fold metallo-hydrolase [Candidatus Promineifilaceae bacterium]
MELTWFGLSCFRLADRGMATVVTDPYNGNLGLPPLKMRGDVVTISHNAKGHNHSQAISGRQHTLTGPGEFEIGNVFITGMATSAEGQPRDNVLFTFDYNGLMIAHLGDMTSVPSQTQIEPLEQVHVLLLPVGGGTSLNASQAAELVSMLEPSIVVPMHYKLPQLNLKLDGVERFLKEMGVSRPDEEASLKVTNSSLPEETQVVVLSPKGTS